MNKMHPEQLPGEIYTGNWTLEQFNKWVIQNWAGCFPRLGKQAYAHKANLSYEIDINKPLIGLYPGFRKPFDEADAKRNYVYYEEGSYPIL